MVEIEFAIDEAEYVRVEKIAMTTVVWVWHGGTTVNTYSVIEDEAYNWIPSSTMTIQDWEGKPVGQAEIEQHIEMDVQRTREEREEEF